MLILIATNIIGYTILQSVLGTVADTVPAMTIFNNQLTVSNVNRKGFLFQSLRTKLTV
jgi:hypothetical protein